MSPSSASFTFSSEKAVAQLRAEASKQPIRLKRAVRIRSEKVLTNVKKKYVPVKMGTLRRSGRVEELRDMGDNVVGFGIFFGDAAAPYAAAVHEFPDAHVPPSWVGVDVKFHPPGTGPKYLQRGIQDEAPIFASAVAMELEKMENKG